MSVERTIYCDAEGCEAHATTATPPPHLPTGFLGVTWHNPGANAEFQFCGWSCLMRHAASYPEPEIIPLGSNE